jgi:hypothetical protein
MVKPLALAGRKFGRLLAIERGPNNKFGQARWVCLCDCGGQSLTGSTNLVSGKTRSCGCVGAEITAARNFKHGQGSRKKRSRAYTAWKEMNRRVKRDPAYVPKGITVCERWATSFENFFEDLGACPDGYELDRLDNSKGYDPTNVRWATETTQSRNRDFCTTTLEGARAIRADTGSHRELSTRHGVPKGVVKSIRANRSWREEEQQ